MDHTLSINPPGRKWPTPAELAALLQETIDRELPNLLDSASNNDMRFVLASLDGEFRRMAHRL